MRKRGSGRYRPVVGRKTAPVSANMPLAVSTDATDSHACEKHPEVAASFQCDGCGKYLCSACAEEGHRLFFCALCGERALPLEAEAPATTLEHRRVGKRDTPYSLQEALLYPFRGLGGYVYWSYVALLAIGTLPFLGCIVLVFQIIIFLTLPGLLFSIVRTSAAGETELPDWPDWSDLGERFFEWFGAVLAFLVALAPAIVAVGLIGCGAEEFVAGAPRCSLALGGGLIVGAALWIPAFGAVAVTFSPWWALRIDLHIRALSAVGADAWKTYGLLVALLIARLLLAMISGPIPILGNLIDIAIGAYTLFVGAHLIGVMFRRHAAILDAIYS